MMMVDRRKPAREVTPGYEDAGIFKTKTVQIMVDLVPMFGRNTRNDIIIKGFVSGDGAIDVVFPGRRKSQVKPLVAYLQALLKNAYRDRKKADVSPDPDQLRLSVRIEGSWRPRFSCDDQGWQTREFQLYAARWLVKDERGEYTTFGEVPVRDGI